MDNTVVVDGQQAQFLEQFTIDLAIFTEQIFFINCFALFWSLFGELYEVLVSRKYINLCKCLQKLPL